MIVNGILFLFGIVIGIWILQVLFSSWFWTFAAYAIPIVSIFFTLTASYKDDRIFFGVLTLILSIPMFILEGKKEAQKEVESQKQSNK